MFPVILAVFLGLSAEIGVRFWLASKNILSFDSALFPFYVFKRNSFGRSIQPLLTDSPAPLLHIDADGLRSSSAHGKKTIMVMGCSFVFGASFPPEKTFPGKLNKLIGDDLFEVRNAGMPGYGLFQMAELLEKICVSRPEAVLITALDFRRVPVSAEKLADARAERLFFARLKRVSVIIFAFWKLFFGERFPGMTAYLQENCPDHSLWAYNKPYLDRIVAYCQKKKIPLVLTVWPTHKKTFFTSRMRQYARKKKAIFFDAQNLFSYYPTSELVVSPADSHPSELANALMAKAAKRCLSESGLI